MVPEKCVFCDTGYMKRLHYRPCVCICVRCGSTYWNSNAEAEKSHTFWINGYGCTFTESAIEKKAPKPAPSS